MNMASMTNNIKPARSAVSLVILPMGWFECSH